MGYLPFILIGIGAVVGFALGGMTGASVGGLGTYLGLWIAGTISRRLSGGLIPRRLREATAKGFVAEFGEAVAKAFPKADERDQCREVEALLERMQKRALEDNVSFNLDKSSTRGAIRAAADALMHEEMSPERRTVIDLLETYIEVTQYPPLLSTREKSKTESMEEEEIAAGVARWVLDRSAALTIELSNAIGPPAPGRVSNEKEAEELYLQFACEVLFLTTGAAVCALLGGKDGRPSDRIDRVTALVEEAVRSNGLPIGARSVRDEAWEYFESLSDKGQPGFGCGERFSGRIMGRMDVRAYLTAGAAFMQTATSLRAGMKAIAEKSS